MNRQGRVLDRGVLERRNARRSTAAMFGVTLLLLAAESAAGQTFQPKKAINENICGDFLGIFNECETFDTQRLSRGFTVAELNRKLFYDTWATASHCTRVEPTQQKCQESVMIATDPVWNRVVWARSGEFIEGYGKWGTGSGRFMQPQGVDITHRTGPYHVAFVADMMNSRVVVLALNSDTKGVKWIGTINGSASGKNLSMPYDVAWDHAGTWTRSDDRAFIADTWNDRIVVYRVSVNPGAGTMSKTFLAAFGTRGSGSGQFRRPHGVAVQSVHSADVYTDVYVADTGNRRISQWTFNGSPGTPNFRHATNPAATGAAHYGISVDHYGDVYVADRGRSLLQKYRGAWVAWLKNYGGASTWAGGNFNAPSDVHMIYHYTQDWNGDMVAEGLPYIQTTEKWTNNTGGQLHRLGVDVHTLRTFDQGCNERLGFTMTGYGSHRVVVRTPGGGPSRHFPWTASPSGWRTLIWDGRSDQGVPFPNGTYEFVVSHKSGYTYDAGTGGRLSGPKSFNYDCTFHVTADVPGFVTEKAWYPLDGSATHTATDWRWDQAIDDGGWSYYSNQQNSGWTAYAGHYTVNWKLSAQSTQNGTTNYTIRETEVAIGSGGGGGGGGDCVPKYPGDCPPPVAIVAGTPRLFQASYQPADPTDDPSGSKSSAAEERPLHFGSGIWIGIPGERGGRATRLYSFRGNHESEWDLEHWPNLLEADSVEWTTGAAVAVPGVQVKSRRREWQSGVVAYGIALRLPGGVKSGRTLVGLAADPDLGLPGDDELGFDRDLGLVWVRDGDSIYVGYLALSVAPPTVPRVVQFGLGDTGREPLHPEAAFAALGGNPRVADGKRGDVRFLLVTDGRREGAAGEVRAEFAVLRAGGMEELRTLAKRTLRDVHAIIAAVAPEANFAASECVGACSENIPASFGARPEASRIRH